MQSPALIQRIDQIRRRARWLSLMYGAGIVIGSAVALLLAIVLADYLLNLPSLPRVIVMAAALAGMVYLAFRFVARPATTPLSLNDIAGRLERAFPQFEDRLRSTVDFLEGRNPGSGVLQQRVIEQADAMARNVNLADAIVTRPAYVSASSAATACLLMAILAFGLIDHKVLSIITSRLLTPFSAQPWPKRVQIAMTSDLPTLVPVGQRIDVQMKLDRGDRASLKPILFYQSDNGPTQQMFMSRGENGQFQSSLDARLDPSLSNGKLNIWIEAGDDTRTLAPITIVPRLSIKQATIAITPPPYVKARASSTSDLSTSPAVTAEGSRLQVSFKFNKPLGQANPTLETLGDKPQISAAEWSRPDPMTAVAAFDATKSMRFHLRATDSDGFTNTALEEYELIVKPDTNLSVQLENPRRSDERTADAFVPLQAVIEDDCGADWVKVVVNRLQPSPLSWEIPLLTSGTPEAKVGWQPIESTPDRVRFRMNDQWELATPKLTPGDVIEYSIVAQDNFNLNGRRHDPVSSSKLRITIVSQDDLAGRVTDELRAVKGQASLVRISQQRSKQETQQFGNDTQAKPALDAADVAASQRLSQQQASTAASAKQLASRLQQSLDRLNENRSTAQEIKDIASDVKTTLENTSEGEMKAAAQQISAAAQMSAPQSRQASQNQTSQNQASQNQASQNQTSQNPASPNPNAQDANADAQRPTNPSPDASNPQPANQPQPGQPQADKPQAGQPKSDPQQSGQNPSDPQQNRESQPSQAQSGQQQSGQQQANQQQPGQQPPSEQQSGQPQAGQQQSSQQQANSQQANSQQSNPQQANSQQSNQQQPNQQQPNQQQSGQQQASQQTPTDPVAQQQQDQRNQTLASAQNNQQKALDQIDRAMAKMETIGSLQTSLNELAAILAEQRALRKDNQEFAKTNLGKKPEQLPPDEKQKLDDIANRQAKLGDRTQQALDRMNQQANQMQKSDPSASQAMSAAAQQAQQSKVTQNQQRASQQTSQNQQASAQQSQQQVELGLEQAVAELKEAQKRELARLQQRLAELQEQLATLIRRQSGHNLDNLLLQGPEQLRKVDPKVLATLTSDSQRQPDATKAPELRQLSTGQELTDRNTRDLARNTDTEPQAAAIGVQLIKAAAKMERAIVGLRDGKVAEAYDPEQVEALAALVEAKKQLDDQKTAADEKAQQQQKDAIRQRFVNVQKEQVRINTDTQRVEKSRDAAGELPRTEWPTLTRLPTDQAAVGDTLAKIDEDLSTLGSIVYIWANRDIKSAMDGVKEQLAASKTGVPTQAEQERIVEQLNAMIDNLKEPAGAPDKKFESANSGNQGGNPPGGGQGQQRPPQMPTEIELRLLKSLQSAVNTSTTKINTSPEKAPATLATLGGRQGELRTLLDSLLKKASRDQIKLDPEPENKDVLPEETAAAANPEQADLEAALLGNAADKPQEKIDKDFKLVGTRMARSRQRLAMNNDPGTVTQEIQKKILTDFDDLIDTARRNAQQQRQQQQRQQRQQGQPQQAGQPQPGQQQANAQNQNQQNQQNQNDNPQQNNTPGAINTNMAGAGSKPRDLKALTETAEEWGGVTDRVRKAVIDSRGESIVEQYRKLIEDYYGAISTQATKKE